LKIVKDYEWDDLNKDKAVVVFGARWCLPCKQLEPIVKEIAKKYKSIKFYKYYVDDGCEISNRFYIRSVPTIIIFEDGIMQKMLVGLVKSDEIESAIRFLLK
jgi:thioredoxin 1